MAYSVRKVCTRCGSLVDKKLGYDSQWLWERRISSGVPDFYMRVLSNACTSNFNKISLAFPAYFSRVYIKILLSSPPLSPHVHFNNQLPASIFPNLSNDREVG